MSVSVVIPTFNGAHKITRIIESLSKQTLTPEEIIVVIDGSTDNTEEVLKELQKTIYQLRVIRQENKGRAAVRNKGGAEAKGELLVFFDDDMLPEPDCIEQHHLHHQKIQNSILTGAQMDPDDDTRSDIQQYKSCLSKKWIEPIKAKSDCPLKKEEIFLTAANFSVTKMVFEQLGGFDERLTDAEDFDLAVRAFNAGVPLYYNHQAFAWHNDEVNGISYVRRLRQYREAHKRLLDLKSELYKDFMQTSDHIPHGLKKLVFLFFAKRFWIKWLKGASDKSIIPKKVRYKLYDIIFTANGVYFPEKVPL